MNNYKFIQIADIHVGPSIFGDELYKNCLTEFFKRLTEVLRTDNIDAILIPGDIYKKASPSRTDIRFWNQLIMQCYPLVDLIVIGVGNHDLPENDMDSNIVSLSNDFVDQFDNVNNLIVPKYKRTNTGVVSGYEDITLPGGYRTIRLFNYIPKAGFDSEVIGLMIQECDIAMMHATVQGAKTSSTYTLNKKSMMFNEGFIKQYPPKQKLLLMGDIHYPQTKLIGDIQVQYCGSPIPIDYGEDHKHGYLIHNIAYNEDTFEVTSVFIEEKILRPVTYRIEEPIESSEQMEELCQAFNTMYTNEHIHNVCKIVYKPLGSSFRAINKQTIEEIMNKFDDITFEIKNIHNTGEEKEVEEKYSTDPIDVEDNIVEWAETFDKDSESLIKRHREVEKELERR